MKPLRDTKFRGKVKHLGYAEITVKVVKAKIMVLLEVTTLQDLAVVGKCCSCNYIKRNL